LTLTLTIAVAILKVALLAVTAYTPGAMPAKVKRPAALLCAFATVLPALF